jgi:hypothetical protein
MRHRSKKLAGLAAALAVAAGLAMAGTGTARGRDGADIVARAL